MSPYQQRRQEEERLGVIACALSVIAAVLFVLITAQAAGYDVALPISS